MRSSNINYLPQIDSLRALAALWIVFYHGLHLIGGYLDTGRAGDTHYSSHNLFMALMINGHSAVALFMVLSGFIFTYGAFGREIIYSAYVRNRMLRIYPLFLTLTLVGISANASAFSMLDLLSTVLPLADLKAVSGGPLIAMAWAVSVEVQFYLIFPFLLAFANKAPVRSLAGIIVCAILLRAMAFGLGANPRDISYWHLIGRIDQFVAGMSAAIIVRQCKLSAIQNRIIQILGAVLIVVLLLVFDLKGGWHSAAWWKLVWPTFEGFAYSIFLIGCVGAKEVLPGAISRVGIWIGERSFSIYLLHFPVVQVLIQQGFIWRPTGNNQYDALATTLVFALPVTLALSCATYSFIELPFLSLRVRYLAASERNASTCLT